jgi:uncharacterized protein YecE (DUF72 family)
MIRNFVRDTATLATRSESADRASRLSTAGALRIGCAGWSIPRQASQHFLTGGSHLQRYAQVFNACEINSSFYRPHREGTWERWRNSVRDNFRFAIKAPRTITHESSLNRASDLLPPFLRQISLLNDKLGPILFQLPPSSVFNHDIARQFLTAFREGYKGLAVWEPRHPSWFVSEADDLLKKFQIARVASDPACVPLAGQPGGYDSLVYLRLHGSPRRYYSSYTDEALNVLSSKLPQLTAQAKVWCVFDNTASGAAIENALSLLAKIRTKTSASGQ